MDRRVNINFHFGGQWAMNPNLQYLGGDVDVVPNFDPDYMCYEDILFRYKNGLGFINVKNIFVRKPGKDLEKGLYLVNDDDSIRRTLYYISKYSWVSELDFYAQCEIDEPMFAPVVLPLPAPEIHASPEIQTQSTQSTDEANVGDGQLPTQCSRVGSGDGNIEPQGEEHTPYVAPSGYVNEKTPEAENESDNESDSESEAEQGNEGQQVPNMNTL